MTEKRFTLLEDTNGGLDNVLETMVKDNGKFLTHRECCDLLNNLHEENQEVNERIEDLYEADKSLRKMCSNVTHNWNGICVKRELFEIMIDVLISNGNKDLADDLSKTSIDTGINGC